MIEIYKLFVCDMRVYEGKGHGKEAWKSCGISDLDYTI
jgi:hypothetical protein